LETARISHATGYAVKEFGRLSKSLILWFLELVMLAVSYAFLLIGYVARDLRSDLVQEGLRKSLSGAPTFFAVVVLMCFMNFIQSGYIVTSLIARILSISKSPKLYPLILPCLVAIHISIIRLMDHGDWGLSINFPLFAGWGVASAFVIAWYSVKLQSSPKWGARNMRQPL
jgi:hypothetical protein